MGTARETRLSRALDREKPKIFSENEKKKNLRECKVKVTVRHERGREMNALLPHPSATKFNKDRKNPQPTKDIPSKDGKEKKGLKELGFLESGIRTEKRRRSLSAAEAKRKAQIK